MTNRFYSTPVGSSLFAALLLMALPFATGAEAQDVPAREAYLTPPDHIAQEVLAPRHENVRLSNMSPNAELFLNSESEGLPALGYFARPHYNIAGLQIDPQANRSRSMSTNTTIGLEVIDTNGQSHSIQTPDGAKISHARWSPDGEKVAFYAHYDDATHLYVANVRAGESTRVSERPVLPVLSTSFDWTGDSNYLFTVLTPSNFGPEPAAPAVPGEPKVRHTAPEDNRLRTYPSLIESKHEEALLEHFTTGQLARIDVNSGRTTEIGEPAMIRNIDAAPNGEHVRVQTIQKPFSHFVPVSRFAYNEEIWDLQGESLVTLRESAANLSVPDSNHVEDFNRSDVKWRPDGQGLSVILEPEDDEEEDEENGENAEDEEENGGTYRVAQWLPPFGENDLNVLYETDSSINSVAYPDNADILFITERRRSNEHVYAVYPEDPEETYTIYRNDRDDFYDNPGSLQYEDGSLGERVVQVSSDGSSVFLSGTQYYEDYDQNAPRPFLDQVEIQSGDTERLFQSAEDTYERILAVMDQDAEQLMLERQSATTIPDSWLYDRQSDNYTQLTENVDYNQAVTVQAQRERVKVERADGFEFWMDVVLPADWNGEGLPGLIWHYPREYDDQEDYEESARRHNINSYPRVGTRTADILVSHGYAVLKPDWPIAGDRGTSNDNFVWSIVQNSTAVINEAAERGYVDRDRMAIGGHSYGAFGTSNAMIHTSFFRAGIAGAGNYNRTLTPMGFQREGADLWRGQDRYMQMSPIFWADRLDGALLMYHGAEDQNVGTFPINSERMLHALNGIGKTAALYMYPHESHGQRAEETLLDMWTRWSDWLDHYVKNKGEAVSEDRLVESRTPAPTTDG